MKPTMKMMKHIAAATLITSVLAGPFVGLAADQNAGAQIQPYTLKTCIVSDEKLGEMGKPYVFTNGTHEIKLCCKSCLKDFKKDPAKYIKKLEKAEAKAKK